MRVLARVTIPVESGNRALQDKSLPVLIQRMAETWHPEAMYFTAVDGRRSGFIVVNLQNESDIVAFSEPFYSELNAEVQMSPVMNGEDLQKGLSKLGQ